MSAQPIDPTPAPEATTPAPDAPQEPAAAAPEAPKPAPPNQPDAPESKRHQTAEERLAELPGWARNEITQLRESKVKATDAAEQARAEIAKSIGKALGLVEADESVDPAELTKQLTAKDAEARQAKVALAIYQTAQAAGGDPLALLDSASFQAKVASIDPTDTAALTAAIAEAVAANPRLGAANTPRTPAPNPAQGSSASGPATPAQLSEADVKRMYAAKDYAGIEQARQEGRLANVLGA